MITHGFNGPDLFLFLFLTSIWSELKFVWGSFWCIHSQIKVGRRPPGSRVNLNFTVYTLTTRFSTVLNLCVKLWSRQKWTSNEMNYYLWQRRQEGHDLIPGQSLPALYMYPGSLQVVLFLSYCTGLKHSRGSLREHCMHKTLLELTVGLGTRPRIPSWHGPATFHLRSLLRKNTRGEIKVPRKGRPWVSLEVPRLTAIARFFLSVDSWRRGNKVERKLNFFNILFCQFEFVTM